MSSHFQRLPPEMPGNDLGRGKVSNLISYIRAQQRR